MSSDPLTCPVCGTPTVPGARFCHHCGAPLDRGPAETEAERRVVTVLFGDLSDFTGWAEDLDPERVGVVTDRVLAALSKAVTDLGGHVDKLTGDGIMAVFGAPTSHGDDAERAVRAAARMQREVRRLVADEGGGGQRLGLRVGLNTGEVLAGIQAALSYTVVGDAVNTASRLSDAAGVGSVYAGQETALATRRVASWRALAPLRLKGKREPVPAYELVGLRSSALRGEDVGRDVALVGRQPELARLVETLHAVVDQREPATALVVGEAGVGKTRLVQELARVAGELPGARVLWGRCTPHGEGRDLAPLLDWVRTAAGVPDEESPDEATVADRVRRLAARVEPSTGWLTGPGIAEGLLALLGLARATPGAARSALPGPAPTDDPVLGALAVLLRSLAAQAPLVLVADDLQTAGPALTDALVRLGERLAGAVLLVGVARAEPSSEPPAWWARLPRADVLTLEPLDDASADRLLRAYLGGGELAPEARRELANRARGNPYFLAELVQLLVDRGELRRAGDRWELDIASAASVLPAGVRATLAARIDALDPTAKGLLRDAAVVGVRVPLGALEALGHDRDEIARALGALGERGLMVEPAEGVAVFRHPLARDVAYAGLPKAERARRHACVAEWAAEDLDGLSADVDTFVGMHAERAATLATEMRLPPEPVIERARLAGLHAYGRLGTEALDRDEHASAADLLGRALALAQAPYGESAALVRLLRVRRAAALARGRRLAEAQRELGDAPASSDPELRAPGLVVLGLLRHAQRDDAGAVEALLAALAAAGDAGDDRLAGEALRNLGLLDYAAGRLVAAERRFAEALDLAERTGDERAAGWALQNVTWSATTRGDYTTAEQALRRAGELFAALDDRGGLSWCAGTEAFVRVLQGRFTAVREVTLSVIPVAEAMGERWGLAAALVVDAIAAAELGDITDARREAEQARVLCRASGDVWGEMLALVASGFAERGAAEHDTAVAVLRQALELARSARYPVVELLAGTALGYCHLDREDLTAAEEAAHRALDVLGVLEMEPHAYVGPRVLLAQVLRKRGKLDEALALLDAAATTATAASLLFPRRQALAHWAGALLDAGRLDEAAAAIRESLAVPAEDIRSQVVALRVRAAVLRAQGLLDEARRSLQDALRLALSTESCSEVAATERLLAELSR